MNSNGSVVITSELEGGEGRASISNSTVEIDLANGVLGGSLWTTRECIAGGGHCWAVEAVQGTRPVNDNTSRTSVSEGKSGEEESLDITQDEAGAPLCQKYILSNGLVSGTSYGYLKYKDSQFEARKRINASIMMAKEGTFTMISRVVVIRHLGGLLCAVGLMVFLFNLLSLHP